PHRRSRQCELVPLAVQCALCPTRFGVPARRSTALVRWPTLRSHEPEASSPSRRSPGPAALADAACTSQTLGWRLPHAPAPRAPPRPLPQAAPPRCAASLPPPRRRRSTGLSITARFEVSTYPPKW